MEGRLTIHKLTKVPRLKEFSYIGPYAYFITICTPFRSHYFIEEDVVKAVLGFLIDCSTTYRFKVYAYCFMPDHLHLLLQGEETSSLKEFMRIFKQKTEWYFKKNRHKNLWQRSYYDHILRKEEAIEDVCRYILENPVRKGLVKNFKEYPFSDSLVIDIKRL